MGLSQIIDSLFAHTRLAKGRLTSALTVQTEAGDCCPYIVQYIAMYATDTFFFCNQLIAGVGNALRLYEFGKKKLLRKAECADFPNFVTTIHGSGDRVYVGDVQESFHYIKYKKEDSTLYVAADDTTPRHVTSAVPLDYDTMCGGDKFGNVFVTRLTKDASVEILSFLSFGSPISGSPRNKHMFGTERTSRSIRRGGT